MYLWDEDSSTPCDAGTVPPRSSSRHRGIPPRGYGTCVYPFPGCWITGLSPVWGNHEYSHQHFKKGNKFHQTVVFGKGTLRSSL